MRLTRLKLTNFRQHEDTEIEFEGGLTGIIGPNGAGKSTILEAITWAMYGGTALRGTNDSLRFRRAAGRAPVRVELEFELSGHRYRVVRGLSMAELYLDGGAEPIANSVTDVAAMLQRRLGMTRAEFFNTYFTGQKDLAVMNALSATERAKFLSRVLGYERLRVAQELCTARRKELTSEIAGMRSGMADRELLDAQERDARLALTAAERTAAEAERLEHETKAALESVAPRWLAAQTGRDERKRLENEIAAVDGEALALARSEERLAGDLAQVEEARTALTPLLPDLAAFERVQGELELMRSLEVHDGRRRALLETQGGLAAEVQQLTETRDRYSLAPSLEEPVTLELEQRRKAHEDAQGKLELRRTEWVRDRQEVDTRLRALRVQYAELRDQRDKLLQLGEEGVCPTCTRPLGTHFRDVLEVLERQMELVEADGAYFKSRLEQLEKMPADIEHLDELRKKLQAETGQLERKLQNVQNGVAELRRAEKELASKSARLEGITAELVGIPGGYAPAEHERLELEHARLAESTTLANRLSTRIEREPALRREQEALARQRAVLTERHAAASARLAELSFPDEEYHALRRVHDEVAAAYAEASRAAAGARAGREIATEGMRRATEARAEHDKVAARVEALEQDRRLHDELHRAYSDLRTDLNFQLRPEVSEIASNFITDLTDARYTELELDDKYQLVLLEEGVPQPVMSGGEEDVANLVLRLAISQMIADRTGQSFSLLVLDEVFGSLDDVRRQNVLTLLRGLHDRFEQVIVITHIEGVRDGLDRVISVGFDERTGAAVVSRPDLTGSDVALLAPGSAA